MSSLPKGCFRADCFGFAVLVPIESDKLRWTNPKREPSVRSKCSDFRFWLVVGFLRVCWCSGRPELWNLLNDSATRPPRAIVLDTYRLYRAAPLLRSAPSNIHAFLFLYNSRGNNDPHFGGASLTHLWKLRRMK